jgi:hypothetical protein
VPVTTHARTRFAAALDESLEPLTRELVDRSVARIPEYASLSKDGLDQKFLDNVRHHLEVFCDILRSRELDPERMAFAYQAARERAQQGMSLASILQSYQLVTLGLWHWATAHPLLQRDESAVRECWPLWLDYVDRATRASADAYLVASRERAHADADARRTFVDMLLSGRLTELEWNRWLTSFGYDGATTSFAVAVLRWWGEEEYRVLDSAMRTAHAAALRLRAATGSMPIDAVRDREVVFLVPVTGASPRRIQEELARALAMRPAPDLAVSGAVSGFVTGAAQVVEAYGQSLRVVRVTRRTGSVACVDDIGLFDHAVSALRDDVRRVCRPELASFVRSCAADPRDVWLPTIRAWVESDMNVVRAAARLHVHRNTVYYRLSQLSELLGSDLQTVRGLIDVVVAVELSDELTRT